MTTTRERLRDAHRIGATIEHRASLMREVADDCARAAELIKDLVTDAFSQAEYVGHLERRLAERVLPPVTVLGTLAAMEAQGARVAEVLFGAEPGFVRTVRLYRPGDEHPTEHMVPDVQPGCQTRFADQLRAWATEAAES